MIGRVLWLLVLAVVALVACFAQLDRAARFQPALSAMVPPPFRGFAAQRVTEQAIIARNGPAAMQAAQRLVRARPLPAEHMRLLSQAAALEANAPLTLAALEAAATRGWRDPVTQLAAAQSALLQGQYEAAAQRLGALYATGSLPEQRDALLAEMLEQPGGRTAFADYLATPSRGRDGALTAASRSVPPGLLAPALAQAQAEGAALPCDRLNAIAASYRATGHAAEAALIWPGTCPQS